MLQSRAKAAIEAEIRKLSRADVEKLQEPVGFMVFCTQARLRYPFKCKGDPHQHVSGWVNSFVQKRLWRPL